MPCVLYTCGPGSFSDNNFTEFGEANSLNYGKIQKIVWFQGYYLSSDRYIPSTVRKTSKILFDFRFELLVRFQQRSAQANVISFCSKF